MNIIVNGQNEGYYWRVEFAGREYGHLYNTASTADGAREQALAFVQNTLGKYDENPSENEIRAYLGHSCEAANHTEENCDLSCPWCGKIHGFDGYCDDVDCPNYKGGLAAGYLERNA